jgi:hypothetical protein
MKKLVFLLLLLYYSVATLNAQWMQTNGPYGGTINCLAFNGSNAFAGTYQGVYLSSDDGNVWTQQTSCVVNASQQTGLVFLRQHTTSG